MIKIVAYKLMNSGSLKGVIDIEIEKWGGFQINGMKIFESSGRKWLSMPSTKSDKKNEKTGKDLYFEHCRFPDKKMMDAFQAKVFEAIADWLKAGNVPAPVVDRTNKFNSTPGQNEYQEEQRNEVPF